MIKDIGRYFVYRHIRNDNGNVFYIGIGTKDIGKSSHKWIYYRAYNKKDRGKYWKGIVSKTDYSIEILVESDDREFIMNKEKEFIKIYGKVSDKTGTLVNFTNGGNAPYKWNGTIENNSFVNKSKKVYLYNLGGLFIKQFKSHTETALYLGSTVSNVSIPFRNKYSSGNYIYSDKFLGEKADLSAYNIKKTKIAIYKLDLISKEIISSFSSIKEASDIEKINHFLIYHAVKNKRMAKGFLWIRQSDFKNIDKIKFKTRFKEVYRKDELGNIMIYKSVTDAAKDLNIDLSGVSTRIRTKKKIDGFLFSFKNDF